MSCGREPRSVFYDGQIYGRFVEPVLAGVHGFVVNNLPPGDRVLEACCGTGGLARKLADAGRRVTGVDLSPRNIAFARRRAQGRTDVDFHLGDVSLLQTPEVGRYDVATVVLALHEMPAQARLPVLSALLTVASTVMIVDYAVPMPRNLAGLRNRAMELAAGRDHFTAFRDFGRRGGLAALVRAVGGAVITERRIDAGTLQVVVVRR
jgi:SAM-dependent methyltransferase